MDQITLNILRSQNDILKALFQSKVSKSIIGIKSEVLGPGTYMTSVVEILVDENDDATVVLKGYDMTGYFLNKSTLKLEEIESVIPFTAVFENPFLRDFQREIENRPYYKMKIS
jgi:hypothetical protein